MSGGLTGNAAVDRMAAGSVLLVAAIAAVVSYMHIEDLAAAHGQTDVDAHLLPLSVDGLVAAASLSMIKSARTRAGVDWLQRTMLGLGVAATLAANVLAGWPHGPVGAAVSGWPAVAFIGSAEMAIRSIRKRTRAAAARDPELAAERAGSGHRSDRTAKARAAITSADVAAQLGVSERTARRRLAALRGAAATEPGQ